jgi:hypothetical protein
MVVPCQVLGSSGWSEKVVAASVALMTVLIMIDQAVQVCTAVPSVHSLHTLTL